MRAVRGWLVIGSIFWGIGCAGDGGTLDPVGQVPDASEPMPDASEPPPPRDTGTDSGVADAGFATDATATDSGPPDAGLPLGPCHVLTSTLASRTTADSFTQAPIDLQLIDGQLYVAWFDGFGLRATALDDQAAPIEPSLRGRGSGASPRLFVDLDGQLGATYTANRLAPPQGTRAHVLTTKTTGTSTIVTVENGRLTFGAARTRSRVPGFAPFAYAGVANGEMDFAEVRWSTAFPLEVLDHRYARGEAFDLFPYPAGFWLAVHFEGRIDVLNRPFRAPSFVIERSAVDSAAPLLTGFELESDDQGWPWLFYTAAPSRLADVYGWAVADPDASPVLIQRRAAVFSDFEPSVIRYGDGWAIVWSDFRDTLVGSNFYTPRNLYFSVLGARCPADRQRRRPPHRRRRRRRHCLSPPRRSG